MGHLHLLTIHLAVLLVKDPYSLETKKIQIYLLDYIQDSLAPIPLLTAKYKRLIQ